MAEAAATLAAESEARPVHVFPLRVYYEDTDAAGIVYYANYLKFAERARTELLRSLGLEHSRLRADAGTVFIVRQCVADYLKPARLDDRIEVHTRVVEVGAATLRIEQDVQRDGEDLARLRLRLACVDGTGRPVRLPPALRSAFDSLFHSENNR